MYQNRNLEETKGEVELLKILKTGGASVSYPIQDLNNNQVQEFNIFDESVYGVLFSFAEGEEYLTFNMEQLSIDGREIAFIHNITVNLNLSHQRKQYDFVAMFMTAVQDLRPAYKDFKKDYLYLEKISREI